MSKQRRWRWLLLLPPLAASHACSFSVTSTESPTPTRSVVVVHKQVLPASTREAPQEADTGEETDEQAWRSIADALGKAGTLNDNVLAFTFPRDDLDLTLNGYDVPPGAGAASEFRFYRCPCGLMNVIGQFVVADYEANDVLDALRESHVEIASVSPLLLHERPRLLLIRFQGENRSARKLAGALRTALTWTGKERMAPQKLEAREAPMTKPQ